MDDFAESIFAVGSNTRFPSRLMEILDVESKDGDIVAWLPHGRGFTIQDKKRFESDVLPKYFKEAKYTSFTRRLNRWSFIIQRHGHKKSSYFHPQFIRNDIELCNQMKALPQQTKKSPCRSSTSADQDTEEKELPIPMVIEQEEAAAAPSTGNGKSGSNLPFPPPPPFSHSATIPGMANMYHGMQGMQGGMQGSMQGVMQGMQGGMQGSFQGLTQADMHALNTHLFRTNLPHPPQQPFFASEHDSKTNEIPPMVGENNNMNKGDKDVNETAAEGADPSTAYSLLKENFEAKTASSANQPIAIAPKGTSTNAKSMQTLPSPHSKIATRNRYELLLQNFICHQTELTTELEKSRYGMQELLLQAQREGIELSGPFGGGRMPGTYNNLLAGQFFGQNYSQPHSSTMFPSMQYMGGSHGAMGYQYPTQNPNTMTPQYSSFQQGLGMYGMQSQIPTQTQTQYEAAPANMNSMASNPTMNGNESRRSSHSKESNRMDRSGTWNELKEEIQLASIRSDNIPSPEPMGGDIKDTFNTSHIHENSNFKEVNVAEEKNGSAIKGKSK